MNKLSIIIPVYNGEKYIDRCLESILSQDNGKLEIILINDGSRDNSAELCDKYASSYPFVKCIHKANGGVSSARNAGLEAVTGDYVWFVDVDDEIADGAIDVIFSSPEAPLTVYDFCTVTDGVMSTPLLNNVDHVCEIDSLDNFFDEYIFSYRLSNSPCNKVYSTRLISDGGITFNEDIRISEDLLFNLLCFKALDRVLVRSQCIYKYIMVSDSAMHSKNQKVFEYQKMIADVVKKEFNSALTREKLEQFLLLQLVCAINLSKEREMSKKQIKLYINEYIRSIMDGEKFSRKVVDAFLDGERASFLSRIKFKLCYAKYYK